jgi:hypothetical protein
MQSQRRINIPTSCSILNISRNTGRIETLVSGMNDIESSVQTVPFYWPLYSFQVKFIHTLELRPHSSLKHAMLGRCRLLLRVRWELLVRI